MKNAWKYAVWIIYHRKKCFIFVQLVILVSSYFLLSALFTFFLAEYRILSVENILNDRIMINIRVIPWFSDSNYYDKFEEFEKELKNQYKDRYGKMMYMYVVQDEEEIKKAMDAEKPFTPGIKTLFMEGVCDQLCKTDADLSVLFDDGSVNYPVLVGSNIIDQYPVGSKIPNIDTGNIYEVAGAIPAKSKWVGSNPFGSDTTVVDLDDCIICKMDEDYFTHYKEYYGSCFQSVYVSSETDTLDEDKRKIREIAFKNNIKAEVCSTEELVDKERENRGSWIETGRILTYFVILISFFSFAIASVSDILNRIKDIGIMRIYGVSGRSLFFVFLVENSIKVIVASGCACVWFLKDYTVWPSGLLEYYVFPAFIVIMSIITLLISIMDHVYVYRSGPLDMIRIVRL